MRAGFGLCALAMLVSGCGAASAISEGISGNAASQPLSGGVASLQTAPYANDGTPAHVTPAPAVTGQASPQGSTPDFTSVAANYDPALQRFIWVLPPGVHGEGPWGFDVEVRLKGQVRHEMQLPLQAQTIAAGSRVEFPAGYEVIRLTDDGRWAERTAELDTVVKNLIAEHGRGDGEMEFSSLLKVSLDAAARQKYCVAHERADIRAYVEEAGKADLITLVDGTDAAFSAMALKTACES